MTSPMSRAIVSEFRLTNADCCAAVLVDGIRPRRQYDGGHEGNSLIRLPRNPTTGIVGCKRARRQWPCDCSAAQEVTTSRFS